MIKVEQFQALAKWIFTFFCLFYFSFAGFGQRARLFSTDTELSNSLIYDLKQDHKGIIWVATEDGLNRYDGSKVSIYRQNDSGPGSVLHDFVHLIFEDSHNRLFFGFFNGLQIYDAARDRFNEVPLLVNDVPVPAHVLTMLERPDGSILVGTSGQGVFLLDMNGETPHARQIPGFVPSELVNYLYEDKHQNLWVATQDKGLFRLRDKGAQPILYKSLGNNISSIHEDSSGNLYLGSLSKGLLRYNYPGDTFERLTPSLPVKVLLPTSNNEILIGTDGEGIKLFDPQKNTLDELNFNVSNFDLSKSKIHAMMEDDAGNVWLGIFQKGVIVIPSSLNNFQYIGYQSVKNNIIGSSYVVSILRDRRGTLWVGTDGDGLYGISEDGKQVLHYGPSKYPASVPATIMCMFEDSKGNFWIGSYLDGLGKLDRATGAFMPVEHMLDNEANPARRIFSITEDNHSTLWVGTLGFGLYSIDLETGRIQNYSNDVNDAHPNDAANVIHNSWINSLYVSADDKLYVGTPDGIACYDLKTKTFSDLKEKFPSLAGEIVLTFHGDHRGGLWAGTAHGLTYINPGQTQLSTYTIGDGLPSNVICSIEEDGEQNLWIATNYGISKFNPATGHFINYYYHDGLQGNEFSKRASFKDSRGRLYFGGINGVTYFSPEAIKDTPKNLKVAITGFYLHNEAVKKGMKSGKYDIVDTAVMDARTFHLAHDDNSFSIEFSTMEYVNPKRISYLYSIGGNQWITMQPGTNSVTFNDLEPGEYTFKVKAKDFATFSETKKITIIIHPAWYLSAWAQALYLLISLLILSGVFLYFRQRYEARRQMREHQHQEQINQAKLEFFTNVSHEIRTPLSLIINPLKKLIASDSDVVRQKTYRVMRRNSERILHLVNQLMDLRKIDRGKVALNCSEADIVVFIRESCEIFEEQILAKSIDFRIDSQPGTHKAWIDPDLFDKTIQNLVSNAIKFTPQGGKIRFLVEKDEETQHLMISLSDSGIGLKESEAEKIFDRFYQAPGSKDHHAHGTGIGLHLTRSIIELHHGAIRAENNKDGIGSRFIVQIPLGNAHLDSSEIEPEHTIDSIEKHKQPAEVLMPEETEKTTTKSKSKKWVLVVDDDEDIRNYVSNELSSEYHTAVCGNGKEALSWILAKKPDLVVSDVVMPEMDGISLCRKIKQNVNINHIPVILLTAKSMEEDNLEGLSIGADAYIVKPFNIEILKKTVQNIIRNREILRNNFRGNQQQKENIKKVNLKSPDEKLLKKITDVINANLGNAELNVEMLSREIGISRVHLHRKMKELTNQSTRDFIRNIRLQQAASLLSNKHMNISEVAFAVGFTNVAHFSNAFKELYGESPSAYMEAHSKPLE